MSAAYIIEAAEFSAGIVIREQAGFRFFAASPRFDEFDRRLFKSIHAAERAVDGLSARK
ncbi:MAG TPA: hypothetical protein VGV37_09490 [Aliidongia sp.]|uniref:hypothetical protein n=1 Tax=Aliidongia sp. TaxID=1914230 RepID=UPI002DDDA17D|nr:hypothetical protein [Aliidongia sp.]HEV2674763.1 hypothetical protein [Aliidongia sp.]